MYQYKPTFYVSVVENVLFDRNWFILNEFAAIACICPTSIACIQHMVLDHVNVHLCIITSCIMYFCNM